MVFLWSIAKRRMLKLLGWSPEAISRPYSAWVHYAAFAHGRMYPSAKFHPRRAQWFGTKLTSSSTNLSGKKIRLNRSGSMLLWHPSTPCTNPQNCHVSQNPKKSVCENLYRVVVFWLLAPSAGNYDVWWTEMFISTFEPLSLLTFNCTSSNP